MTIRKWKGVLAQENVQTGDGRVFAPGALEWSDLPLPLAWLRQGDQHVGLVEEAPVIGTIDSITRAGDDITAEGGIDDANPDGAEVLRMMDEGTAPFGSRFGVSIDGDNWEVEVVSTVPMAEDEGVVLIASGVGPIPRFRTAAAGDPDPGEGGGADGTVLFEDNVGDILERATRLRIRGATLCAVPAFDGAYIELIDAMAAVAPIPAPAVAARAEEAVLAVTAHAGAAAPPSAVFADPQLHELQRWVTVDEETGHVFGHLAGWGTCHIGFPRECITPERLMEGGLEFATPGHVITAEGKTIGTMPIAIKGGHASPDPATHWRTVQAHYDDPESVAADVALGFDDHGIWFSGVLRPLVDERAVHILRASGVSGDWREVGGKMRLIGACSVNTPGFPKPRLTLASGGRPVVLVAAGGSPLSAYDHGPGCGCGEVLDPGLLRRLERLEAVSSDAIFAQLDGRLAGHH